MGFAVINLSYWYDEHIAIRIPNDDRVFFTKIEWVNNLPPALVWVNGVEFVSYISPEWKNISTVFIRNRLPDYFSSSANHCLLLDAFSGEWFYRQGSDARLPMHVQIVHKK